VLSQTEFETLILDTDKSIEGDIIWTQEREPWLGFRKKITSRADYPIFLKGSYNPFIPALSYVIIYEAIGRIYGLDLGKAHRNPDGTCIGEKHKHRWNEALRDKQAYVPRDITALVTEPKQVWQQFCDEAKLSHNGNMEAPPTNQRGLFL
jgi:hypothetical protein